MNYEMIIADPNELEQTVTIEHLPDGGYRKTIKNNVAVLVENDGHKYKVMHDDSVKTMREAD